METVTNPQSDVQVPLPLPLSLWRNRAYLLLWGGQSVSSVGTQVSQLALPLLMLALTHSPAQAGLLAALRGVALLLCGLPAGAWVDRWDRKRVMICCDVMRTLVFASVPLAAALGVLTAAQLYMVSFLEGVGFTFFGLAETASLRRVVAPTQLSAAVAQGQGTEAASSIIGPPVGGVLFGIGQAVPFVADAVSYALSVVSLLFIHTPLKEEQTAPRRPLRQEIGEGLAWLRGQRVVLFLMWLNGAMNLVYGGYTLLLIALAQRLGASSAAIGLMFSITSVGTIIGAAVSPWLQRKFTVSTLMIGLAWIFAVTWPPIAFAPDVIWLGVLNALAFFFVPVYIGTIFTYRLALIPGPLQGRVNSIFRIVTFVSQSAGFVLTGLLIQWYGAVWTVWLQFIPGLLIAIVTQFNRNLRHAGRVSDAYTS